MGVDMREDKLGTCARHLAMAKRCSVPQNTLILTSKAPISKGIPCIKVFVKALNSIKVWGDIFTVMNYCYSRLQSFKMKTLRFLVEMLLHLERASVQIADTSI